MPDTDEPTNTASQKQKKTSQTSHPQDHAREVVETIVFVVVLVLLLKLFITEAFVIPTGSMAETLYGYQKIVKCPKCEHEFPVNSHDEVEGRQGDGRRMNLYGYCCPNCRHIGHLKDLNPVPNNRTGDRVLVLKPLYHVRQPQRGEVVVFKFPEKPQDRYTAQNYIKRCKGFGGETVAIYRGDLYVTTSLSYPADDSQFPRPADPLELWRPEYMYPNTFNVNNPRAAELFDRSREAGFPTGTGGFEIVRKGEDELLADRRIVWDNDKQPKELAGRVPPRWYPPSEADAVAWSADNVDQPKIFAHKAEVPGQHWIRYRHLALPWKTTPANAFDDTPPTDPRLLASQAPTYIDNFLGYNAGRDQDPITGRVSTRDISGQDKHWVGDLILECEAELGSGAVLTLELSKGVNRFQATFTSGQVSLSRLGRGSERFGNPTRPCRLTTGKYRLRFANVDCRLWVWVNDKLIDFGPDGDYQPVEPGPHDGADPEGWTKANDVDAPAGIGVSGQAILSRIRLYRDVYYTRRGSDPTRADIYYVQPGHYLCLGDNSAQSSDSRNWGTVPERLLLGKAVFVFYPLSRIGFIK